MHKPEIGINGNLYWRNEKGEYHREDGPAFIYPNGGCIWYKNGKRHREDGPAVEYTEGYKAWYVHGKFVKDDYEQS